MKKLTLIIAIALGMSLTTFADGGGFFNRGTAEEKETDIHATTFFNYNNTEMIKGTGDSEDPLFPGLPGHGTNENEDAPLGSGMVLLLGFGAAYALKNRKK